MPEAEPTVRRTTAGDLAVICELAQALNVLHHQAWPRLFAPSANPSIDVQHWSDSITGAGRAAFLAEQAGTPLGFVTTAVADESHSLFRPMRYGRINSVCVVPAARGRGVGTRLMSEAEKWACAEGALDMRLVVWQFNDAAVRLYQELGYSIRSLSMGKPLPAPEA